jgi:putative heme-binding domain-containing protein
MSAPAVTMPPAGDAANGAALFSGKGRCSGCHAIRGSGGVLGPDLTNIGGSRTLHQIRQSVVDPGARIEPGYEAIVCVKNDGTEIRGVARNYNNYSAQVLDRAGRLHLLSRAELKSMRIEEKTLMPGGAKDLFTAAELNDLLAFLSRQTVRQPEGASR